MDVIHQKAELEKLYAEIHDANPNEISRGSFSTSSRISTLQGRLPLDTMHLSFPLLSFP